MGTKRFTYNKYIGVGDLSNVSYSIIQAKISKSFLCPFDNIHISIDRRALLSNLMLELYGN